MTARPGRIARRPNAAAARGPRLTPDWPPASPDARRGDDAGPGPRRSGPPAPRSPAPDTGRRRHCRSGYAPRAHRFSPSAPRHPAWPDRHRAHADARTAPWTPRPARRSSPSARAAGRGAGPPCGHFGHPRAGCWCAAPAAIPPAGAPDRLRCRGLQLPMGAGGPKAAPWQRGAAKRRWRRHRGTARWRGRTAAPPAPTTGCRRPAHAWPAATATVPAPAAPGTPSTGVKTCSRQVITRESSWSSASALTAARHPAQLVVGEIVHHELARIDGAAHPRRVGQNVALLDPQRQLRAAPGTLADDTPAPARGRTAPRRIRTAGTGRWESWPTSSTSAHRPPPSGAPSCCSRLGSQDGPLPPRRCFRPRVRTAPPSSPARHRASASRSRGNSPAAVINWCWSRAGPTDWPSWPNRWARWRTCCPPTFRNPPSGRPAGPGIRPRRDRRHPGEQRRVGQLRARSPNRDPDAELNLVEVDVAQSSTSAADSCRAWCGAAAGPCSTSLRSARSGRCPGRRATARPRRSCCPTPRALREELRGTGVTAATLCPGPVDTGFGEAAGFRRSRPRSHAAGGAVEDAGPGRDGRRRRARDGQGGHRARRIEPGRRDAVSPGAPPAAAPAAGPQSSRPEELVSRP